MSFPIPSQPNPEPLMNQNSRLRPDDERLYLDDLRHLQLSHYINPKDRKTLDAVQALGKLFDTPHVLGIDHSSDEAPAMFVAGLLHGDKLPIDRNRAILKGDDHQNGYFTLTVGCVPYFPISLYVCRYGTDGSIICLGDQGHLLWGGPGGRIVSSGIDLDEGLDTMTEVVRNGGLYCARYQMFPPFLMNRNL